MEPVVSHTAHRILSIRDRLSDPCSLAEAEAEDVRLTALAVLAYDGDIAAVAEYGLELYGQEKYEEARYWFELGAEREHVVALVYLGMMCTSGIGGVEKNARRARALFEKAIEIGRVEVDENGCREDVKAAYSKAMTNLGNLLLSGELGDVGIAEFEEAFALFSDSAIRYDAEGAYRTALFYLEGVVVEPKVDYGLELLELAGESGYAAAYTEMAAIYISAEIVPKNAAKGMDYMRKAAGLEDPEAMFLLGLYYYDCADFCDQSLKLARYWLERAAERNMIHAMAALTIAYAKGEFGFEDLERARYWKEKGFSLDAERFESFMHDRKASLLDAFD